MKTASEYLRQMVNERPYRQLGDPYSYSKYKEGWSDALDLAGQVMERAMKEAYNQGLQDAANNVKVLDRLWSCGSCSIDVNSILKLKKII